MPTLDPPPPVVRATRNFGWSKTISPQRDQTQSRVVTLLMATLLALAAAHLEWNALRTSTLSPWPALVSVVFALSVWRLRAATVGASVLGSLICLLLADMPRQPSQPVSPALFPLILLFLLTFAATRFKRRAKEVANLAEPRRGRRASQIAANLGVAGLCAAAGFYPGALAALAEATADTLSSEVGQAVAGPTWMLTTLRRVVPGTDGGISLRGTAAGLAGAVLVTLAGSFWLPSMRASGLVFAAATFGFLTDSLLGATLERRGWLGNDVVNATSTLLAALLAWAMFRQ